jgi:hypothetical protein
MPGLAGGLAPAITYIMCEGDSEMINKEVNAMELVQKLQSRTTNDEGDITHLSLQEAVAIVLTRDERIRRECADKIWPLLKQEYEWRHEDSECGSDEISEGLDMLRTRLDEIILNDI